jgi:hypothetical protein
MATVTQVYKNLGTSFKSLGTNIGHAFERLGMALGGTASGSASLAGKTGGLIATMAKQPVKWVAYGVNVPVKILSGSFRYMPIPMAGLTVLGGGIVAGRWLHNRAERRTQDEMMTQAAAAQAQMAQANPYQITQVEYEAMQARMRDSSNGAPVSHADRVLSSKQAAMTPQPTDTANLAAL